MRLLFALGVVVILGLGVGLFVLTRETPAVQASTVERASEPVAQAETPHGAGPLTPMAPRSGKIDIAKPTTPTASSDHVEAPTLATEPASTTDAWIDPLPPNLRSLKTSLRKSVDSIDSLVSECLGRFPGPKMTGVAHFTVAFSRSPDGKAKVTSVGIDSEVPPTFDPKTVNDTLMHCIQESGKKINPEIPEDYVKVTAKHEVDLEAGNMTEHKLSAFDAWKPNSTEPEPH